MVAGQPINNIGNSPAQPKGERDTMEKMICLGKNYLDHAQELGDAVPEKPVLFIKPASCLRQATQEGQFIEVSLPRGRGSVHFETEIVARIRANGSIDAVTLGLDLTLRDVQQELKRNGHPWEIAKVFPGAAILGPWIPLHDLDEDYMASEFVFSLDGTVKQTGKGTMMRMSPKEGLAYAQQVFPVIDGDALFTGTPAGVGPIQSGQVGKLTWFGRDLVTVQFV